MLRWVEYQRGGFKPTRVENWVTLSEALWKSATSITFVDNIVDVGAEIISLGQGKWTNETRLIEAEPMDIWPRMRCMWRIRGMTFECSKRSK